MVMVKRVIATEAAVKLINDLKAEFGALVFHQSGGCCEGSSPMCFKKGGFYIGSKDVCLGKIEDCEFWMAPQQFEYWKHTQIILDVSKGTGGAGFSLETPKGLSFIIRSHVFTDEEVDNL